MDTIPVIAWSADAQGHVDFLNQRWLEYTGLSAEEAIGLGWGKVIHPDDLMRVEGSLREAVNKAQPLEVEGRFRRADGEYRWFLFRAAPLCDDSGAVVRWYGTNIDLEDRKKAENKLRLNERDLRLMIDSFPSMIALMDASGEVEFVNRPILDFFGVSSAQALNAWAELIHPEDRNMVISTWQRSIEIGLPYETTSRHRGVHGDRWFNTRCLPLRDARGKIERWYCSITDVHDQKRAEVALTAELDERQRIEQELKNNQAHLQEMQSLTRSGSWRMDAATGKFLVSPGTLLLYGLSEDTASSDLASWLERIHPDDRNRVEKLALECVENKLEYQTTHRIILPNGDIRLLHTNGHPSLDEHGDLVEFIGMTVDITDEVEARKRLEEALVEINRLKDQLQIENVALREEVDRVSMFEEIVGNSSALGTVLSRVAKVAKTHSTVLISGETGTGKELIARAIHKQSARAGRPFISLNCAALSPSLVASEMFGHEKGAFTGAIERRIGRFELADGGTLFLDEVGELSLDTQAALLRVLQERQFERLGGKTSIKVDVRIIAATNRNLELAIANGIFRSDLFYRLHVFPIEVPPLRERKDDLLMLIEYFVHRYARSTGKKFEKIDEQTLTLFQTYDWPGNVRELQNVIERSVVLSSDRVFHVDPSWLGTSTRHELNTATKPALIETSDYREKIESALRSSRGRVYGVNGAASKLRIPPSTLDSIVKRLNIDKDSFKFQ